MNPEGYNKWLHRFALLCATATLVLICFGGLVTSHGAGMAVPDWPNTFGYNMFFFPFSQWVGGIFYEHSHRLFASAVGFLTIVLAVWIWRADGRRWVRWLGVGAVGAVVLQGVLGGLRVVLLADGLGIVHAALGQLYFVLMCSLALFTSRDWFDGASRTVALDRCGVRGWVLTGTGLILFQLLIGATMRHQHAGLAIPDFPLAYGGLWPATDADSIARYNQSRMEVNAAHPITAFQVQLQMIHRIGAVAALLVVSLAVRRIRALGAAGSLLRRWGTAWSALLGIQFLLGAATVWSNKSADLATAHVAVGALSLATGSMMVIISRRFLVGMERAQSIPSAALAGRSEWVAGSG
jgi:cytochrome c oxidase assembly protein subunit 15